MNEVSNEVSKERFLYLKEQLRVWQAEANKVRNNLDQIEIEMKEEMRSACPHETTKVESHYHPHNGDEWEEHTCLLCGKIWTVR